MTTPRRSTTPLAHPHLGPGRRGSDRGGVGALDRMEAGRYFVARCPGGAVLADTTLRAMERAAHRSGCRTADIVLAIFGLLLDDRPCYRNAAIAVVGVCRATPRACAGPARGYRQDVDQPVAGASDMPSDLRDAIRGRREPANRHSVAEPRVGYLYRRHPAGSRIDHAVRSSWTMVHEEVSALGVLLVCEEFDDGLLIEGWCRAGQERSRQVSRLVWQLAGELELLAVVLPSDP